MCCALTAAKAEQMIRTPSKSMQSPSPVQLTSLLNRMFRGDQAAGDEAMGAMYTSLRRIASARLRHERPGHILDTRALVNEALLRLFGTKNISVKNRQHFLALSCLLMKRVLIDFGRKKEPVYEVLEDSMATLDGGRREEVLTIDRILDRFRELDPRAYQVLQLKVGAGMTVEEIATELQFSVGTANRALRTAREWMVKELGSLREN
jgi:RNA polymerase sigma factor (TIGR02999 family)